MCEVFYVPWLHMHQPLVWVNDKLVSYLKVMLESENARIKWNAKLIARAYKNPAKFVLELKEEGFEPRIMLDFSGVLLEALVELKDYLSRIEIYGEKIGDIISLYKKVLKKYPECIEFAGTAYSHCYFPATPEKDWYLQIEEWRNVFEKIFGKKALERVKGFWLPELGVPGFRDKLKKLIEEISKFYEWLILPIFSLKGYERLSYEQVIRIISKPHWLEIENAKIKVIFRAPYFLIDQQAGCEVNLLRRKLEEVLSICKERPLLIVPASDGENGNVMMNEFFPKTFVPFFKKFINKKICSATVSQFLERYGNPKSKIELKVIGASWLATHKSWLEGTKKLEIIESIKRISKLYHGLKDRLSKKEERKARKLLLIAETSCYLYWGSEFWYNQAFKTIKKLENFLNSFRKV